MKKGINVWSFPQGTVKDTLTLAKKELVGDLECGNISDLGGYYNELAYFCNKAKRGEQIQKATLEECVNSLEFLLKELAFQA